MDVVICFVAHNAYGALAGMDKGHIGGIERQQALMACWLAKHGHSVSMITWDEGQEDGESVRGVRVFKLCRRDQGSPGLRFFYPRWTSLAAAMRRADAAIYYYNCGDLGLGQVALWANRHGRRLVYSVASDADCDPRLPALKPLRERLLYRHGLRHADAVIVQTSRQREMLKAGFGIQAEILSMPCAGFAGRALPEAGRENPPRILWVGRFSPEKRMEWLLDVAEACPQYAFDVVGAANTGTDYAGQLFRRAEGIRNVFLHGRVVHDNLGELYRRASLLCCTSLYEGFPNTFLEAWSVGLPVVTTFDPDGLVAARGLGAVAGSIQEVRQGITGLLANPDGWRKASDAVYDFFQGNHTVDAVMPRFVKVFDRLK